MDFKALGSTTGMLLICSAMACTGLITGDANTRTQMLVTGLVAALVFLIVEKVRRSSATRRRHLP